MEQQTGQSGRERHTDGYKERGRERAGESKRDRQADHKLNTSSSPHGAGKLWREEGQQHHRFNIQNVI